MIYLIRVKYEEVTLLKIGYAKNIKRRFSQYRTENPLAELLEKREGDRRVEFSLHKFFAKYKFNKGREWFYYDDYIIDNFNIELQELYHEMTLIFKEKIENTKLFSVKLKNYCTLKEKFPEINYSIPWLDKYIEVLGIEKCKELNYDEVKLTKLLHSILFSSTDSEEYQILKDFLDNHYYATSIFSERLRLYCEFRDKYKDNPVIMEGLFHRVTNLKIHQFYNYFGTSGCKAKHYLEGELDKIWRDSTKSEKLAFEIYSRFHEGDRYLLSDLKQIIKEIYQKLSITKSPKASDIKDYFEASKTNITTPEGVKKGFKLKKRLL